MLRRNFDIFLSIVGIALLLPTFAIVALMTGIKLGRPIFFKQARSGINGEVFFLYKFRSMTNECDTNGALKSDNARLTKFGKFLRSTSLDELPSLWNVLIGDMSLVGPRPLLVEYFLYIQKGSLGGMRLDLELQGG